MRGSGSLIEQFAALSDPRQAAKVLYPLPEIVLLLLCATLAGADDFVEAQLWGGQNLAFLRRLLPYAHGVPKGTGALCPTTTRWATSWPCSTRRCSRSVSQAG